MTRLGLFLGVAPSNGGMFQYARSIIDALNVLRVDGHEIVVAYVDQLWEPLLADFPFIRQQLEYGPLGLRLAELCMIAGFPVAASRLLASWFNPIPRQLERLNSDIWIFPAQDSLGYQIRLPSVVAVHDLMHRYEPNFPEVSRFGRYRARETRFRNLIRSAKAVLVDSAVGKTHVVESYGAHPRKVFPLPYVAPWYISQSEPADFNQRYGLPKKFLFYPAQFWSHKNHLRLISALAMSMARCSDVALVLSGGKRHAYAEVQAHAYACGVAERVQFVGFVPEEYLAGFYRRARALIMPTFFGPTNIPPLEAFVCGCPVAASNIYGMPEQLGGAGLLFDPTSVDEMRVIMERLWIDDELCAQLRAAGHAAAKAWNLEHFARRLQEVLETAMTSAA